jgi:cytochrome b
LPGGSLPSASPNDPASAPIVPRAVRVWDLPTRIFHWTLVALVTLAWLTGEGKGIWFNLHLGAGIGVLSLLLFRLQWGVFGSRHARFVDFVRPWPAR